MGHTVYIPIIFKYYCSWIALRCKHGRIYITVYLDVFKNTSDNYEQAVQRTSQEEVPPVTQGLTH